MMVRICLLAAAFGLVVAASTHPVRAVPPNCDNKCRERNYVFAPKGDNPGDVDASYKYKLAVCHFCHGKGGLCEVKAGDMNPDSLCQFVDDDANVSWKITSTAICNTTGAKTVEANKPAIDPTDDKNGASTSFYFCPPKNSPN